ncbi:hypothetical protein TrST_g6431 [Triparma strigata]|uniref:Uncharacterized protein n=1 Tax=Triparma strigata TaxID=1606541 RepID=A0A9W7C0F8_9STRA|nr:hypothetical protein TrST_g6431 [Triparma strigata]
MDCLTGTTEGHSQTLSVTVATQPALAVGGSHFLTQPVVNVLDGAGNLHSTFTGKAYASLTESPTGYEEIRYNGSTTDTDNIVDFVEGRATFSGLYINEAGTGYKLRFIGVGSDNAAFAYVDSASFNVVTGDPFQISITTYPGSAKGGLPFGVQPVVSLQDKGFNALTSYSGSATVSVAMASDVNGAVLRGATTASFFNGVASFSGLYINEAGGPYKLKFTYSDSLAGTTERTTFPFTNGIGVAASITFVDMVSKGSVSGGLAFRNQPKVKVVDAGRNVLVGDSTSTVTVSIFDNPSGGHLLPLSNLEVKLVKGVATFNNLFIDYAGLAYRLQYSLSGSTVAVQGLPFDVQAGLPTTLKVSKNPGNAWAGGQPFQIQPYIDLVDYGNNIIGSDSSTVVHCTVVPSLAVGEDIVITTASSAVVNITKVSFSAATLAKATVSPLGPGDVIEVEIRFSGEVTATYTSIKPYLTLSHSNAYHAKQANANITNPNTRTETLKFGYTVEHDEKSTDVGYFSFDSLILGDGQIKDNLGRAVNDTLRQPGGRFSLKWQPGQVDVDNVRPRINRVHTDLTSAEYGAGHLIPIDVNFTRPVTVSGTPVIPLMVNSTVNVIRTNTTGNITSDSVFGLQFNGEARNNIPWDVSAAQLKTYIEAMGTVSGEVCVMRETAYNLPAVGAHYTSYEYQYSGNPNSEPSPNPNPNFKPWVDGTGFNWIIQFQDLADDPSIGFIVDYSTMKFRNGTGNMVASTMEVGKADLKSLTYDFENDVVFKSDHDTNAHTYPTAPYDKQCLSRFGTYASGSGTPDLRFNYVVMPGDSSYNLDINPNATIELLSTSDNILYDSATPTLQANLNTRGSNFLSSKDLVIDTTAPAVDQTVGVVAFNTNDGTYTVGDTLYFTVKFTKPVTVSSSATLDLGTTGIDASATYLSGSGTDTLKFEYVVSQYQQASDLDYKSTTALSATGTLARSSTTPTTAAMLTLPALTTNLAAASAIVIDGDAPTISTIAPATGFDSTTYTRGQTIDIVVTFSHAVEVKWSSPVLVLDVGSLTREAVYVSGNNTNAFTMRYTVMTGDAATNLGYTYSASAFCLNSGCPATGYATAKRVSTDPTVDVVLTTPVAGGTADAGVPLGSAIVVDTSAAAQTTVTGISVVDPAGTYGVGSVIFLSVTFSDEVVLATGLPYLMLNINATGGGRLASYSGQGDGTNTWLFYFTATPKDAVANLEWQMYPVAPVGIQSATDHNKASPIVCELSAPCSMVNRNGLDINRNFTDAIAGVNIAQLPAGHVIDVTVPTISEVYSNKLSSPYCRAAFDLNEMNCTYTVGEEVDVFVKFSAPVQVSGTPRLYIETGEEDTWLVYSQAKSTSTDIAFTYTVAEGDTSNGGNLTYVCTSTWCEVDMNGGTAAIKRFSTIPTTPANYTLPKPGRQGFGKNGQNIYIDTSEIPKVVNVGAVSPAGTYYPGDVVTIFVEFDEVVVVTGVPLVNLELGANDGNAYYNNGTNTRRLTFQYTVQAGHVTYDLDYVDAHGLEVGILTGTTPGTIMQKSTTPTIPANLDLPYKGELNSLGYNAAIKIDGSTPYITGFSSPQPVGEYGVGEEITIYVNFSAPVWVTGNPYIILETGTVDRHATYTGGSNSSKLEFKYTVKLGDASADLDYRSVEEDFRDATSSFVLNGGKIRRMSSAPILDADLHLNPGKGYLEGAKAVTSSLGAARYTDLKIQQRGPNYKLRFSASPAWSGEVITTDASIYVDVSSEYEIMGSDREIGDLFGYSVGISNDVLAVGAPGKRKPISEVQILDIWADTDPASPVNEVQLLTTELDRETALKTEQIFTSSASPHETVGGMFSLNMAGYGSTMQLPVDIAAEGLATFIEEKYPLIGKVTASRTDNTWCACNNAYEWTVTFHNTANLIQLGGFKMFVVDDSGVTGPGAEVSQPRLVKGTTFIEGTFTITNPNNGMVSRDIAYNANETTMIDVMETDLGLGAGAVYTCVVGNLFNFEWDLAGLGRRWKVTFNTFSDNDKHVKMNVPNFIVNGDKLTGSSPVIWHAVGVEGQEPVNGNFTVSLRGSDYSKEIPYHADGARMEQVLEQSCDAINDVTVTKSVISEAADKRYGYSWSITFNNVNMKTDYGWEFDPDAESSGGNLPKIEVNSTELYGHNLQYKVSAALGYGADDNSAWFQPYEMGTTGASAGLVQVSRKDDEQWIVEATIVPDDVNDRDRFGHSVSVYSDIMVAGAPYKEVDGDTEIQLLNCTARTGTFTLKFRGFESAPISHAASLADFETAITGMNPLRAVKVRAMGGWDGAVSGGEGLCSGNHSVLIDFETPGSANSVGNLTGDIEMIVVDATKLADYQHYPRLGGYPPLIHIREFRKGTMQLNGDFLGKSATGLEAGSVYLYKRYSSCSGSICSYWWSQRQKFTPFDDGATTPQQGQEFGYSVYASENSGYQQALVGSPGADDSRGVVYFYRNLNGVMAFKQRLDASSWGRQQGARFGHALAVSGDKLAVTAPGYNSDTGAVYIWTGLEGLPTFNYLPDQMILAPAMAEISAGERWGCAVDLNNDELVICACLTDDIGIHTRNDESLAKLKDSGSCYVYDRSGFGATEYVLREKLVPSNLKAHDMFGTSVSMTNGTIVVGQKVAFGGGVGSTRPKQEFRTFCDPTLNLRGVGTCDTPLGAKFRIGVPGDLPGETTEYVYTRGLSYKATSAEVREALEDDLGLGEVEVERSIYGDSNRGYRWRVTFNDKSKATDPMNMLPLLQCNVTTMTGDYPACTTEFLNPIRQSVRSKAHVFTRDETTKKYTEQCFLFPNIPQRQDMFGAAVTVSDNYAVVGGWNRDLTNVNSGAAMVFDMSFLDFRFHPSSYTVSEGEDLNVTLIRAEAINRRVLGVRSFDRNAPQEYQDYVNQLFAVRSYEIYPLERTVIDEVSGTTAFGRSQYYGGADNRSQWVDATYDYRAISDYELLDKDYIVNIGEATYNILVSTTDDYVFEAPDENMTVQINLPGVFPSQLGSLTATITIEDDDDGVGPYSGRTYYEKFFGSDLEQGDAMGTAVDVDDEAGIMVVGAPLAVFNVSYENTLYNRCGSAYIFNRTSGMWAQDQILTPGGYAAEGAEFGTAVAVDKPYGREDVTVVVGAPGLAKVFVYVHNWNGTTNWALQEVLGATTATSRNHHFGSFRSIALSGDLIAVGARGLESMHIYYRTFNEILNKWDWSADQKVHSSDYDYDVYGRQDTEVHMHRQDFGVSVAAEGRTIIVGAPYADFGKRGSEYVDGYDTDGVYNVGLGKGKVFTFYSQPIIQKINIVADAEPGQGTFKLGFLNHAGAKDNSTQVAFDASAAVMKAAIEAAGNVGEVEVARQLTNPSVGWGIYWTVTFLTEMDATLPTMLASHGKGWGDNPAYNCSTCVPFDQPYSITTERLQEMTTFTEILNFQAGDKKSGDRFGYSLAIDGNQAVIGAMFSSGKCRTTFDFETGDLVGWVATGDAFNHQPTYGDNSKYRNVYGGFGDKLSVGRGESAALKGRYYIGTYENRPGNGRNDYQNPFSSSNAGEYKGDVPMGTLTSDVFVILGDKISFLVGGGCNHLKVYIELLIDGMSVARSTGKCSEKMEVDEWDVGAYLYRAAQIRIVDSGSGPWDHINIDHIVLSWASIGGLIDTSGEFKQYMLQEGTWKSGAAYAYRLKNSHNTDYCTGNKDSCVWLEESRLIASDKRTDALFGYNVAVSHDTGTAIVSAVGMVALGIYKEVPSEYPHYTPTRLKFPVDSSNMIYAQNAGTLAALGGGNVRLLSNILNATGGLTDVSPKFSQETGSLYVFTRKNAVYDAGGNLLSDPLWRSSESVKVNPPDGYAFDNFGYSIALSSHTAVVGAVGVDSKGGDAGAAYLVDVEFQYLSFQQSEFVALEGTDSFVTITIVRAVTDSILTVGYATSDLTATGIDGDKFLKCNALPSNRRDGCGDYQQTSGEVTFLRGAGSATFTVNIMNDFCKERYMEYVQLTLNVPGGGVLSGDGFMAVIRIDDNDWEGNANSVSCVGGIS